MADPTSQGPDVSGEHGPEGGDENSKSRYIWPKLTTPEWISAFAAVGATVAAIAGIAIAGLTYLDIHKQLGVMQSQLDSMNESGQDTKNLVIATQHLADRAKDQADAMDKLRKAGELQAGAMDKLRIAGETQAKAAENLADAGRSQAIATRNLADNSARQLGAIRASADAAKAQAAAVQEQASATVTASKATDRLAQAGQAQAAAVVQSLSVARTANDIASRASVAADRPWVSISMPTGDPEPVAGQDYKVDFTILNVGRSPALEARTNVSLSIIKIADAVETILNPCDNCQHFTIFPSGGSFQATTNGYHPFLAASLLTPDEIRAIKDTKKDAVLLRVRVDYTDTSGTQHMTSSCMYLISGFGFTPCTSGGQAN